MLSLKVLDQLVSTTNGLNPPFPANDLNLDMRYWLITVLFFHHLFYMRFLLLRGLDGRDLSISVSKLVVKVGFCTCSMEQLL